MFTRTLSDDQLLDELVAAAVFEELGFDSDGYLEVLIDETERREW